MSDRYRGKVRAPEFPAGLDWLNVECPLTLQALRGKVVLLDFWTFCCINCMHILPQLQMLEERFPDELVVIGVHSAKHPAEEETYNVRPAVVRLDVRHPVVNDRNFTVWRAYSTRAWPTVVLISPDGYVVGAQAGEFKADNLASVIEELVAHYDAKGMIDRRPLELVPERLKQLDTLLSFPGKVVADEASGRLFVSDTDHHRVLTFTLPEGRLRAVYGSGEPGLVDGSRRTARFRAPQGLTLAENALLVADTGNHAVRAISLSTGDVSTLAGNGSQAPWGAAGGFGRATPLSSPWDLARDDARIFVAMAGSHQIWTLDPRTGEVLPWAGDCKEALVDGPRGEAKLAQPSGLASDGTSLWFVDSETSSLRFVPLDGNGPVRTCIGQGLFYFGDKDGTLETARLQHPLGVASAAGRVYVADSYNHRIKVFDPATGEIRAFAGSGEPGMEDGSAERACFWEPGGLSAGERTLYVADTNNHAVRTVDVQTGEVRTLDLREA